MCMSATRRSTTAAETPVRYRRDTKPVTSNFEKLDKHGMFLVSVDKVTNDTCLLCVTKITSQTENLFVMIIHPFLPGRVAYLGSNMRLHRSRRYDPGDYEWKGPSARLYCLLCVAITLRRIPEYLNDYSSMLLGSHCWHRGCLSDFHGASEEALVSAYWTKPNGTTLPTSMSVWPHQNIKSWYWRMSILLLISGLSYLNDCPGYGDVDQVGLVGKDQEHGYIIH